MCMCINPARVVVYFSPTISRSSSVVRNGASRIHTPRHSVQGPLEPAAGKSKDGPLV
jgi:hypothetical protein